MDWEAFESDVWQSVNTSCYAEQWGSLDDSDPGSGYTGIVFTIGETWLGALYGTEENTYGQRMVYRFDTEAEQREWFTDRTDHLEAEIDLYGALDPIGWEDSTIDWCGCGGIGCDN